MEDSQKPRPLYALPKQGPGSRCRNGKCGPRAGTRARAILPKENPRLSFLQRLRNIFFK